MSAVAPERRSMAAADRFRSLDGLRGVAALVVLAHHALLVSPAISALFIPAATAPQPGSALWWLTYSPLKLTNAGPEAVVLFFVLSGFVLAIPVFKGGFNWLAYFPRRFVRLMLPVAGAVALASVLILIHPQTPVPSFSGWLARASTAELTWGGVLNALNLVNGQYRIDNPLWSIQWEMIFSLALPIFGIIAIVVKRWWMLGIAASLVGVWIGALTGTAAFLYLPVFMIGVLLAAGLGPLMKLITAINALRLSWLIWAVAVTAGLFLLIARWLVTPEVLAMEWVRPLFTALVPVGALLIVVSALGSKLTARILTVRPARFVGRISFSLYLVHVPLIVAIRHLMPEASVGVIMLVAIPTAMLVATGFYYLVEAPAHVLSGRAGRWGAKVLGGDASAKPATVSTTVFVGTEPEAASHTDRTPQEV
jgi:peptidoglycan/LPS O-acetylase OafA/YrhL